MTTAIADRNVEVLLARPTAADGAAVHALVARCKPLDLNSTYAYLLLCEHYADTCVCALAGERLVGFVSAYRPPRKPDVIFVWQVAVDPAMRGKALACTMLRELLGRDAVRGCRWLETTVSPSNTSSRRVFEKLAAQLAAPLAVSAMFGAEHFAGEDHEEEQLIRIGPLPGR